MLLSKKLGTTPGHFRAKGLGTDSRAVWPMPKHASRDMSVRTCLGDEAEGKRRTRGEEKVTGTKAPIIRIFSSSCYWMSFTNQPLFIRNILFISAFQGGSWTFRVPAFAAICSIFLSNPLAGQQGRIEQVVTMPSHQPKSFRSKGGSCELTIVLSFCHSFSTCHSATHQLRCQLRCLPFSHFFPSPTPPFSTHIPSRP